MHGIVGEVWRQLEAQTEASPAPVIISLLTMFGNAVGRDPHYRVGADRHGTNLYTVTVGRSGVGRKGMSYSEAHRIMRLADAAWSRDNIGLGLASGEGIIESVRDPVHKMVEKKEKNKGTGEFEDTVIDPGVSDKRRLFKESEFGRVIKVAQKEHNITSAVLREAWDGGDLGKSTIDAKRATRPHISIIGHITDAELKTLSQGETLNGFANRFLFVWSERTRLLPDGGTITDSDLMPVAAAITEALRHATTVGQIKRDKQARTLWHHVYGPLTARRPGLFGAATGRAEAQVLRLSLIYALLDCALEIRIEHLEAALEVWRYCQDTAAYLFDKSTGHRDADRILSVLEKATSDGGAMTKTELHAGLNNHLTADSMNEALAVLDEQELVQAWSVETGGRRAEMFRVAYRPDLRGAARALPELQEAPELLSPYSPDCRLSY